MFTQFSHDVINIHNNSSKLCGVWFLDCTTSTFQNYDYSKLIIQPQIIFYMFPLFNNRTKHMNFSIFCYVINKFVAICCYSSYFLDYSMNYVSTCLCVGNTAPYNIIQPSTDNDIQIVSSTTMSKKFKI